MGYKPHPNFTTPPLTAGLWKYVDFTKFVSILEKRALFFSSPANFSDPFEGSYPAATLDLMPGKMRHELPSLVKLAQHLIFVDCWHRNDFESAAMWRLYSAWDRGIAISTTLEGLANGLQCSKEVHIGEIQYIDYHVQEIDDSNIFVPYLTKRKSFEHEREVRAIILLRPEDVQDPYSSKQQIVSGIYCQVDLDQLIGEVIVSPQSEEWFVDLVRAVVERYDLKAPVQHSSLADSPPV